MWYLPLSIHCGNIRGARGRRICTSLWLETGLRLVGVWLAFDYRSFANHILPLAITLLGKSLALPLRFPFGWHDCSLVQMNIVADLSTDVFIYMVVSYMFCKWSQVDRQPIGEWYRRVIADWSVIAGLLVFVFYFHKSSML